MMVCIDKCSFCKHNRHTKIDGWIPTCDAFPNGQPLFNELNYGEIDYTKDCNNGIGFELSNEEDKEQVERLFNIIK